MVFTEKSSFKWYQSIMISKLLVKGSIQKKNKLVFISHKGIVCTWQLMCSESSMHYLDMSATWICTVCICWDSLCQTGVCEGYCTFTVLWTCASVHVPYLWHFHQKIKKSIEYMYFKEALSPAPGNNEVTCTRTCMNGLCSLYEILCLIIFVYHQSWITYHKIHCTLSWGPSRYMYNIVPCVQCTMYTFTTYWCTCKMGVS